MEKIEIQRGDTQFNPSFNLSTNHLKFSDAADNLKITIKNLALKTTSYEIILSDQEHFKIFTTCRTFTLAPGISKQIPIKHIHGTHCSLPQKQIMQARVRDFRGNSLNFQCCCPNYKEQSQQTIVQYPKNIDVGEFDHRVGFGIEIKNISHKNLKIIFNHPNDKTNSNQENKNILISNPHIKLECRGSDSILLAHESIKFNFELHMPQYGKLNEKIYFKILIEEEAHKLLNPNENVKKLEYYFSLVGYCVSKKLVIKDENMKITSQISNQMLTGTSKSSCFYIETQYHEDAQYTLQAYIEADTPQQYAQKWKNISIQFNPNQQLCFNDNKFTNMSKGILKKNVSNKIQYRINTNYTIDDENYVSKYSKIKFEDDSNALRMRNSQHSKKYQDIQLKFQIKFSKDVKKSFQRSSGEKSNDFFQTIIPFKCTLINPSLRCQITQSYETSDMVNVIVFNETKINIPYSFPMHSLYRVTTNNNYNENELKLAHPLNEILYANKKEIITIKWTKEKERCLIYMEIPNFDLVLYEPRDRELKEKNMIALPPSRRRPQTSISSAMKQNEKFTFINNHQFGCFQRGDLNRMNSLQNLKNFNSNLTQFTSTKKPQFQASINSTSASVKKITVLNQLPKVYRGKNIQQLIPSIQDLQYLLQFDKTLKNTHPNLPFILQIIDKAYLILNPGQFYCFDGSMGYLIQKDRDIAPNGIFSDIRYRVFGHNPIYTIRMSQINSQNVNTFDFIRRTLEKSSGGINSSLPTSRQTTSRQLSLPKTQSQYKLLLYQRPTYQILCRQIKMSFKQSKQQFQIVEYIPIKNCSSEPLEINCITVDGEFFKCNQPNGILIVSPEEIGKFKIAFKPQNNIRLSILNKEQPRQQRRKAMIKNAQDYDQSNLTTVKRDIKLMINKNLEVVTCIGQIIEKSCSIKPQKVKFLNCKYGSPEIIETLMVTNTSPYKISFIIENPPQISIKPKSGIIMPKTTHSCTITFKPCKKISNYSEYIKIFIGGSHMELVPLLINVQDPEIYIKEKQLIPEQLAICGFQNQQLNLEMTLINDSPAQSFIQLNLKDTPLYIGYSKNYHSNNSSLVMQNFIRCSQVAEEDPQPLPSKQIVSSLQNSIKSIMNESHFTQVANTSDKKVKRTITAQKCSITLAPNTFLIIPLTLRINTAQIGTNTIKIDKNIAALSGYGQIESPKIIKFNCNKTLLHISPYKHLYQIVLTQNQKNYQINLQNLAGKILKIKTKIKQIKQVIENKCSQKSLLKYETVNESKEPNTTEPSIICTFKDIDQYLAPQGTVDLNMSFICFEAEKKIVTATYELNVYVKQCDGSKDDPIQGLCNLVRDEIQLPPPYFSTKISVVMPQPFLQLSPHILVMPTVGINTWSRDSFIIKNHGYKEIFVKIKKPINITFDLDCQIVSTQTKKLNKSKHKNKNSQHSMNTSNTSNRSLKQQPEKIMRTNLNQLTKINNVIEVRVCFRSKTRISFNVIIQIEDNFGNKYEMPIVGTCTDSPFFTQDGSMGQFQSNDSFHSNGSFNSDKSLSSEGSNSNVLHGAPNMTTNTTLKANNLQPGDIEDLIFLNNWVGSIIPEISNQSTFFYVWLTKTQNFVKFLREFKINIGGSSKLDSNSKNLSRNSQDRSISKNLTLTLILQELKQQGFQLNSLRIYLLEKADQLEWLKFMWFFLSKAILYPNFLNHLAKEINFKELTQINYTYIYKNYQQILTTLMITHLNLKKQSHHNSKPIDWKYLLQNFEPLLSHFKIIQSQRHLILSLNVFYHKINNVEQEVIEISDFEFVMNISNPYSRKVRYFLQCDPRKLICEESSNKILPTKTTHGYSFMAVQNQQITITFSLRNISSHALTSINKNVCDLMDIIMFNNIIWDPITIFHIKLKQKQDIIHNVTIECQCRSTQQWVYKFESKMTAQYRIFFDIEPDSDPESIRLLTGQPGLLKKGESTTLRIVYSPTHMKKCNATLKIVNTLIKEVFKISGKPVHSSKIQYEKCLKIIQSEPHEEIITLNWENGLNKSTPTNTSRALGHGKISDQNQHLMRGIGSQSERNGTVDKNQGQKTKKAANIQNFEIKIYNPLDPTVQPPNKYVQCITKKQTYYNPHRKQLKIHLGFKYDQLIRNLQLILQVLETNENESKLIRLAIDIVPKPIVIKAEIEAEFNSNVVENIRFPNLLKIPQNISIQYKYISSDADVKKFINVGTSTANNVISELQNMSSMLSSIHKGLFQVLKTKNNEVISFNNPQNQGQKVLDFIELSVKFSPNQNNCSHRINEKIQVSYSKVPEESDQTKNKQNMLLAPSQKFRKRTNNSVANMTNGSQAQIAKSLSNGQLSYYVQLPYFYITATYLQSLYEVTYLFKPILKKTTRKPHSSIMQVKRQKVHQPIEPVQDKNTEISLSQSNNITQKQQNQPIVNKKQPKIAIESRFKQPKNKNSQ